MIIETILVILGVLTTILGIWNIIIGAYIWGGLFLIGGIWAIGLGCIYIAELRKERKKQNSTKNNLDTSEIEFLGNEDSFIIPDDGIQVENLFEEPVSAPARSESNSKEEVKVAEETVSEDENEPVATWRESTEETVTKEPVSSEEINATTEIKKANDKSPEEMSTESETISETENVESKPIDALNIVLIDEEITPEESNKLATEEEIRDFEAESEKEEETTDEKADKNETIILEAIDDTVTIKEENIDYESIVSTTNQLVVVQDEENMSLMITEMSAENEEE